MTDTNLVARFQEIDAAIQNAKSYSTGDVRLQSYLAAYLVVLICGLYEDSVEYLVALRAAKSGDTDLENFVRQCVDRLLRSPKFENIGNLVGLFGKAHRAALERRVSDRARTAISSIVTNRNSIAHGKPIGVTIGEVEGFHSTSKAVFEALEAVLA